MKPQAGMDGDERLTAYALGEVEGSERHALEARLAEDAAAREQVEEVRDLARLLEEGFAGEGAPALDDAQRAAIVRAAHARGPRAVGKTRRVLPLLVAAAASIVAGGGLFWGLKLRADRAATEDVGFHYHIFGGAPAAREVGLVQQALPAIQPRSGRTPGRRDSDTTLALRDLGSVSDGEGGQGLRPDTYGESYARIDESPFIRAADDPRSTFSIDVDTASYANVRRILRQGQLPPADAVRIEELVNYFPYAYAPPAGEHPFAVHVEVTGAPWAPRHRLVRIGLKGAPIALEQRKPANLVFLIDVSGSMDQPQKLPLVRRALHLLVNELSDEDRVALVVYAGAAGLVLPPTSAHHKITILDALDRLQAGGSTAGGAGIQLAYRTAREAFVEGGINRVILATDGDFNVGVRDEGGLTRLIEDEAKSGVFLTVLGFGMSNLQDAKLETLANRGNGHYAYIDSLLEARKVLVEELGATLETIAKDVKVQVEFNPTQVAAHRLIGYENRLLAHQDFTDDAKDAGEIGAGHTVTALYEIVPFGVPLEGLVSPAEPSELRYQTQGTPSPQAFGGELLHVALRYKRPDGATSVGLDLAVRDGDANFHAASADTRFAAAVAAFGMLLRGSERAGGASLEDVQRWASEALGPDPGGYRAEFLELVRLAMGLPTRLRGIGYAESEDR